MTKRVCRSNTDLLAFAEDEYLSELLLRRYDRPKKKGTPERVAFEWGLVVGERRLQSYLVEATGVTRWSLDGAWSNAHVVELELPEVVSGVRLVQMVPGRLDLACAELTIEKGRTKSFTLPARIDPTQFLVWGPRTVTWRELREWLDVPGGLGIFEQRAGGHLRVEDESTPVPAPCFGRFRFQQRAEDEPWLAVTWSLAVAQTGHYLTIERGTCDDAAWERATQLPSALGDCEVLSGTVRCTGKEWVETWAPVAITRPSVPARVRST